MSAFPKDRPVVDRELMALMRELLPHCEWPIDGLCDGPLECCHVRARGMGGGRRKDVPENLFIACQHHHRKYDGMGQSRKNQGWVKRNVIWQRAVWIQERLQEFSSRADGER